MHWVACRVYDDGFQRFVLVFDLGDEVFCEILLPPELPDTCELPFLSGSVSVYGNSIAYSYISRHGHDSHHFILWVMKEYGVASSWMPFYTADGVFRMAIPWPIGFRKNADVVFILREGQLVSWNRESKEFKDLRIIGYETTFVHSFVESLVLLDKATNSVVIY
nr:F-box/kelch-repeat protein At3g06240-like [Quercus suber]